MSAPKAWLTTIAAIAVGACATPARRLPPRVVDDPVTLPARMMVVNVQTSGTLRNRQEQRDGTLYPSINYGLTDRLQLVDFFSLKYALLDDAPSEWASTGSKATGAPLSMGITGGLLGLGYSTGEGWIAVPRVAVDVSKRLGERVRVGAYTAARATVSDRRQQSSLVGNVGVVVQTTERVAVDMDLTDVVDFNDFLPSSDWKEHYFSLGPGLSYRPWHWFTLGLDLSLVWVRSAPVRLEPTPDMPIARLPVNRDPQVWGIASTAFYW
jgi:hypothetical protein